MALLSGRKRPIRLLPVLDRCCCRSLPGDTGLAGALGGKLDLPSPFLLPLPGDAASLPLPDDAGLIGDSPGLLLFSSLLCWLDPKACLRLPGDAGGGGDLPCRCLFFWSLPDLVACLPLLGDAELAGDKLRFLVGLLLLPVCGNGCLLSWKVGLVGFLLYLLSGLLICCTLGSPMALPLGSELPGEGELVGGRLSLLLVAGLVGCLLVKGIADCSSDRLRWCDCLPSLPVL